MLKIRDLARLAQVSVRTLRYYDELGLLPAAWVDPWSGYRSYDPEQLAQLYRILALKDLGCSLDEIAELLRSDLGPAQLHGLLIDKRRALQQAVAEQQERLARVTARIAQLEQERVMPYEILTRPIPPQRVICTQARIAYSEDSAGIAGVLRAEFDRLAAYGAAAPIVIWEDADRAIDDQYMDVTVAVPAERAARVQPPLTLDTLPGLELAACAVHQGSTASLSQAYVALHAWSAGHGYRIAGPSRTVFVQPGSDPLDQAAVIEVQLPVMPEQRLDILQQVFGEGELQRWSERARQVLALASGSDLPLTTDRLLLGLLGVPKGFAGHVLQQHSLRADALRAAYDSHPPAEPCEPGSPISVSVQQVLRDAYAEAQQRGHSHIGTEHLLLGILRQPEGAAVAGLRRAGADPQLIQATIEQRLQSLA
jgi:DNA-binding transcriptional MerR regulator